MVQSPNLLSSRAKRGTFPVAVKAPRSARGDSGLHCTNSTVDHDLGAGHEARFVGGEKDQRPAHFLGPAEPADRHLAAELLLHDVIAEAVAIFVEDGRVD